MADCMRLAQRMFCMLQLYGRALVVSTEVLRRYTGTGTGAGTGGALAVLYFGGALDLLWRCFGVTHF